MVLIDLVILLLFSLVGFFAIRRGVYQHSTQSKKAVVLVAAGMAILAVLFVGDLVTTYLLPSVSGDVSSALLTLENSPNIYWLAVVFGFSVLVVGLRLIARSIDQYENSLNQSESRYQTIVEDQADLIVRWDMQGVRTWVNDAYCDYFEQTYEELVGTSFFPLLEEDVRQEYLRKFQTLTPDNPSLTGENTLMMEDGSQRWQEWTHHVIFSSTGRRIECQSVGRDITVRKLAEFALKESENRYRDLVDNTTDWVWRTDLEFKFTDSNSQVEVILGYNEDELLGLSCGDLYHPDELDERDSYFTKSMDKQEGWQHWQFRLRHKDGSYRILESNAIPLLDSAGTMIGFAGIDRDVTFKTLLADASSDLLAANMGSLQIDTVIGKFAEYFKVDRFELWWRDPIVNSSALTYSWSREGTEVANSAEIDLSKMPLALSRFAENEVVSISDTSELSSQFINEAVKAGMSISKAFALLPLTSNEGQYRIGSGRVAVYDSPRDWSEEELNELQLAFNLIATAEARIRSEADLRYRERFNALVAEISTDLLKNTVDDMALTNALHRFAEHFEVDSLSCWWFDRTNKLARRSCTWFQQGANPGPAVFELGNLPQYEGPLLKGEVVRVSDMAKHYPESSAEMALSKTMGITASLSVPLEIGIEQDFVGCGVALKYEGERDWPDQEVEDLQLAFNVIAIAEARMQSEDQLLGREKSQAFFAEISTSLIDTHHKDIGEQVDICLEKIAKHYALDRATLWNLKGDDPKTVLIHEWTHTKRNIVEVGDDLALDSVPWIGAKLLSGEVVRMGSLEELPSEEKQDRAYIEAQGFKSVLAIPLSFENKSVGVATFNTFWQERSWSDELVSELQLLAEVLMNAILRSESTQTIQDRERDLNRSEALASVGSYSILPNANLNKWPPTGRLSLSQELYQLLNVSAEYPTFDDFVSGIHHDDRARVLDSLSKLMQEGTILQQEYRVIGKNGKVIYVEDRTEVDRKGVAGEIIKVFGTLQDISDRVLREHDLRVALAEIEMLKENLEEEAIELRDEIKSAHGFDKIIGSSEPLRRCLDLVNKVAPTDATVMLLGETGSGKELIAHAVHDQSARKKKRMISVNCAALPESLIESELFGHEKGAFTGAGSARKGRFELADKGTLFLDEIGELPLSLQSKLLRVIQEGEFERLGGSKTLKVDVRLIAATNRQLKNRVDEGEFRADLYYRISNFPIDVPSLSDRKDDIPLLAEHFVRKFAPDLGRNITAISSGMLRYLTDRSWPGNVRELEGFIQHALITNEGDVLTLNESGDGTTQLHSEDGKILDAEAATLSSVEHRHIINVLNQTAWMISGEKGAAKILGVPPSTLRSRMKKLGIESPDKTSTLD